MMGGFHLGRRASSGALADRLQIRRPLALRATTTPTTASRGSTCAISRPNRSSGRCPTRAAATPLHSSPRIPSICSSPRASRFRCRRAASPIRRITRRNSTACSPASKWIRKSGEMSVGFQMLMPPLDFDLASTGKGPSSGCVFFTSYNTEMAGELLEVERVAEGPRPRRGGELEGRGASGGRGQGTQMDGVPVLDPAKVPGVVLFHGDRQIAARHGCRSERQVARRRRQTAAFDDGHEHREDQGGDREEGLSRATSAACRS